MTSRPPSKKNGFQLGYPNEYSESAVMAEIYGIIAVLTFIGASVVIGLVFLIMFVVNILFG